MNYLYDRIWNIVNQNKQNIKVKEKIFLILSTLISASLGLMLWAITRIFIFSGFKWALCVVGYAGFFVGFVGGVLYIWNNVE